MHPAALSPLALALAILGVARAAVRVGRADPLPDRRVTNRAGILIATGLVGVPALAMLADGTAAHLQAQIADPGHWRLVDVLSWDEVVPPLAAAVLLIAVAAAVSGAGPVTAPVLLVGWGATFVPLLSQWARGGADGLFLGPFAVLAAMALAWTWRPVALQLQNALADPRAPQ